MSSMKRNNIYTKNSLENKSRKRHKADSNICQDEDFVLWRDAVLNGGLLEKNVEESPGVISQAFIDKCHEVFDEDPKEKIARNAICCVGSMLSTTDSNRINEITYSFMNTVKRKHVRATDQGASGRCWMFAALNTFRHLIIDAFNLENFEFSETYLFFWDKFERANSYLHWFIDHPQYTPGSREYEYMLTTYLCDGGWWNTFSNLIDKYGIMPRNCMNETATSVDSEELNQVVKDYLDGCVNYLHKNRHKLSNEKLHDERKKTLIKVYSTLVKFLGEPPKNFSWTFNNSEDDEATIIASLEPRMFREMVMPNVNFRKDFVTLTHIPTDDMKMETFYHVSYTNNVYEADPVMMYNTHIDELAKYAMISISKGLAVWFAADVSQSFNWYYSALDDKLNQKELVFEPMYEFNKGDRITCRNIGANHAMALTGFNVDHKGNVINWQVENSWGYYDHETPGLDGFLTMSHSWFKKYVMEIVVNRNIISAPMRRKLDRAPVVEMHPWDNMAPATRVGVVNRPQNYKEKMGRKI